jgi:hypothetical protein
MKKEWLKTNTGMTLKDLNKKEWNEFRRFRPEMIGTEYDHPGGFIKDKWEKFTSCYRAGDEIWVYVSDWNKKYGREGYAIVRSGEIVANIGIVFG